MRHLLKALHFLLLYQLLAAVLVPLALVLRFREPVSFLTMVFVAFWSAWWLVYRRGMRAPGLLR